MCDTSHDLSPATRQSISEILNEQSVRRSRGRHRSHWTADAYARLVVLRCPSGISPFIEHGALA